MSESSIVNSQIADVVCPVCFHSLEHAALEAQYSDRYGRKKRKYYGWCLECNRWCEVEQFERAGRWLIHTFREGGSDRERISTMGVPWQQLNEMPEPPPVVVGPGGDYTQGSEPKPSRIFGDIADRCLKLARAAEACRAASGALHVSALAACRILTRAAMRIAAIAARLEKKGQ